MINIEHIRGYGTQRDELAMRGPNKVNVEKESPVNLKQNYMKEEGIHASALYWDRMSVLWNEKTEKTYRRPKSQPT